MKCKYCNTINEDDAVFCKKCGHSLLYEEEINSNKKEDKNKSKPRTKQKTKVKKKIKKVNKNVNKKNKADKKMSFGQKLLLIIMTLIIIILLGACALGGYYYYQEQNIKVPNVVGLTYTDAVIKLADSNLNAVKVEKEVDNIEEDGIVIKQNKKTNTKVAKNSKIKLTIGVLKKYTVPNFIGKTLDEAKNELTHNNIKYEIEYKESEKENNIILDQTPTKRTKIDNNTVVTLIVSKKVEDKDNNESIERDTNEIDNNEEEQIENE